MLRCLPIVIVVKMARCEVHLWESASPLSDQTVPVCFWQVSGPSDGTVCPPLPQVMPESAVNLLHQAHTKYM